MPEYFPILPPQLIPTPTAVQSSLPGPLLHHLRLQILDRSYAANSDAATVYSDMRTIFVKQAPAGFLASSASSTSKDDSIHDEYFCVRRVEDNAPAVFIYSLLEASALLFHDSYESPFTIAADKLDTLDRSLSSLAAWMLGTSLPIAPRIANWQKRGDKCHSMTRWIRGHQIFAVLTQGLIASFSELRAALEQAQSAQRVPPIKTGTWAATRCPSCAYSVEDDQFRLSAAVDRAVLLLNGSAASLEFTGDFPPGDYNDLIRPTMTPPLVPETFSGLLSVDHRFLVQRLREMKPSLDLLAGYDADHHMRIAAALGNVYDSHRFVCDRLVGKCPSLMMASSHKKSGAEQVEKFKHLRMKVFESDKRPVPVHN